MRRVCLLHALVLGVGAEPEACEPVDLVAGLESRRVSAHRGDLSRQHQADDRPAWSRDAEHQAHGDAEPEWYVRTADEDVAGRHRGRPDPYADLVVLGTGPFHFSQLEDIRSSVSWTDDRSHEAPPRLLMRIGYQEERRREPPGGGGCGRPVEGFRLGLVGLKDRRPYAWHAGVDNGRRLLTVRLHETYCVHRSRATVAFLLGSVTRWLSLDNRTRPADTPTMKGLHVEKAAPGSQHRTGTRVCRKPGLAS